MRSPARWSPIQTSATARPGASLAPDGPSPGWFPTTQVPGTARPSGTYTHNPAACDTNLFRGTSDDVPFSDINGNVETQLNPVNPWLGATEPFTIIRVGLVVTKRATDGQDGGIHHFYAGTKVFGIQK